MSRLHQLFAIATLCTLMGAPRAAGAQDRAPEPHAVTDIIVRPGDVVRLKLWPEQQYSGDYQVETSGLVAIPLLGEIHVAGLSLQAVRDSVRERYRALTQNGIAIVSLQFHVSVLGQVVRPGYYAADATQSVFDVLSQAGGATPNADLERVRLLRDNRVVTLNAAEALQTGAPMLSVLLESGDRIVVPEKAHQWLTWQIALSVLQTVGLVVALARNR